MYELVQKYLLEAFVIAFAVKTLLGKNISVEQLLYFTVSISLTFFVLRTFAPKVLGGAKQGAGFGLGSSLVGFNTQIGAGREQKGGYMDDKVAINYYSQERMPTISSKGQPIMHYAGKPTLDLYEASRDPQKSTSKKYESADLHECFMDDPVAIDYYSHNRFPKVSSEGQPIMHLNEREHTIDLYSAANEEQVSTSRQVNVLERFMDDKRAMNSTSVNVSGHVHEPFESFITGQQVNRVEGFLDNTQLYVYGTLNVTPEQKHVARIRKTLYSGDLVNLTDTAGNRVASYKGSHFVQPAPAKDAKMGNTLFKLRFQLASGHETLRMVPIRYKKAVYLMYNTDTGENRKVNHNGDLNLMKTGKNTLFEIVKASDPNASGAVSMAEEVLLRKSSEGETAKYLKVNAERHRVETTAKVEEATKFTISSQKGCGPLWRFDSDTRGTNLYNSSQVNEMVNSRTQRLENDLEALKTQKASA